MHDADPTLRDFQWQRGFEAFSVSRDRVDSVVRYIERQEEHHRVKTFAEDSGQFLKEFGATSASVGHV